MVRKMKWNRGKVRTGQLIARIKVGRLELNWRWWAWVLKGQMVGAVPVLHFEIEQKIKGGV